jgi:lipopolysaccharide/colanic/teichoic acid biosynthesis glycosyltransferase
MKHGAPEQRGLYAWRFKRPFDIAVGSVALVVSLPFQAIIAGAVGKYLGKPVLYRQERPGLNAQPFEIIKFRTMTDGTSPDGALLPDELRITRFGRLLRSTSLDELPELFNVVKGDMSLVGPRPLLMRYVERYSDRQAQRHLVRPGLTGLAQVTGRNNQDWEAKFESDLEYVERLSFLLDLRIIGLTIWKVLSRADISYSDHVTTSEFLGTPERAESDAIAKAKDGQELQPRSGSRRHSA